MKQVASPVFLYDIIGFFISPEFNIPCLCWGLHYPPSDSQIVYREVTIRWCPCGEMQPIIVGHTLNLLFFIYIWYFKCWRRVNIYFKCGGLLLVNQILTFYLEKMDSHKFDTAELPQKWWEHSAVNAPISRNVQH